MEIPTAEDFVEFVFNEEYYVTVSNRDVDEIYISVGSQIPSVIMREEIHGHFTRN
jgi:hypothetical protein